MCDSAKQTYLSIILLGFRRVSPQKLSKGLQVYIIYAFKSAGDTAPNCWYSSQKFETTHMRNRLPSSTGNSYREEERDSRVFLKACDEPASQLKPDRDKIFNFPENIFSSKFRSAAARVDFSHLRKLYSCETSENAS